MLKPSRLPLDADSPNNIDVVFSDTVFSECKRSKAQLIIQYLTKLRRRCCEMIEKAVLLLWPFQYLSNVKFFNIFVLDNSKHFKFSFKYVNATYPSNHSLVPQRPNKFRVIIFIFFILQNIIHLAVHITIFRRTLQGSYC